MSDRLSDAALDKLLAYRACSHEQKCLDVSPGDPFGWCPDCVVTALASEVRASRANGGGGTQAASTDEPNILDAIRETRGRLKAAGISLRDPDEDDSPRRAIDDCVFRLFAVGDPERAMQVAAVFPHPDALPAASPACHWCRATSDLVCIEAPLYVCEDAWECKARIEAVPATSPPAPVEQAKPKCSRCNDERWVWGHELRPPESPPTDTRYQCPACASPPASAPVEDAPDYVPACECGKPTPLGLLCLACASAKDVTSDGCAPVEDARAEFPRAPRDEAEREACADGDYATPACHEVHPDRPFVPCWRDKGHADDHVSSDGERVLARWPSSPPPSEDTGAGEGGES